jgi:hypothetical protein
LWAGRWQRAALVGRRDTRSLLTTADAAELIRAAEDLAAVGYDVSQVVTPENASGAGATARDLVHAVAAQAAAGHPEGLAERQAIIAATPGMAASTRDGAIGDLVAARSLERVRNGVYKLLRPAPAGVVLPATDPADEDLTGATAPAE